MAVLCIRAGLARCNLWGLSLHPGLALRHSGATTRTPRQDLILERRAQDKGMSVAEAEREAVQNIPIGRMVKAEDIASLIVFLVSTQASAITGQVIAADGGAGRGIFY